MIANRPKSVDSFSFCALFPLSTLVPPTVSVRKMNEPKPILLAEDEDNDVFFIMRALQKASILNPVERVKDGQEALAYLLREPPFQGNSAPVLVLLDMRMPKLSGLEVITRVRERPELDSISLVVLTFTRESPDLEKALEVGANGWLLKPVTTEGILEMMIHAKLGFHISRPQPNPKG